MHQASLQGYVIFLLSSFVLGVQFFFVFCHLSLCVCMCVCVDVCMHVCGGANAVLAVLHGRDLYI